MATSGNSRKFSRPWPREAAQELRRALAEAGLSQEVAAELVGVTARAIRDWQGGKAPRVPHRALLANVFKDRLKGFSTSQEWTVLRRWLTETRPARAAQRQRTRLVAVDCDGTLIQGIKFSWREVWQGLGYEDDLRREGFRKYLRAELSYAEWCAWCCDHFKARGLTKQRLVEIARASSRVLKIRIA